MNVHNDAHRLANSIKKSKEFEEFLKNKEKVDSDEKTKEMVNDFRKKLMKAQMEHLAGKEVDEEETEKLQKLEEVLMLNPTIKDYFMAEIRFSQLISDVYSIIEDAIDIKEI